MDGLDFNERRKTERPATGEAPFSPGEVFISRTDKRGVIASGNAVFQRVSAYGWDELIGAPHKIIRHPKMPKGVFWLLWDRILAGNLVCAYVNNLAKDGLNYWVFALVSPINGGFISARIKPTSGLRAKVEGIYAETLKLETEDGMSPKDSAAHIVSRLSDEGFENYESFMIYALGEELAAESRALGLPVDDRILMSRDMLQVAQELRSETENLVSEFSALSIVPHNMRLAASRLEPTGGPFSTLSRNYGAMSQEMSTWFQSHVLGPDTNFASIAASVNHALYMECASDVISRCDRQLRAERRKLGEMDIEAERRILVDLADDYRHEARGALRVVAQEAARISDACSFMRRQMLGLSTSRVACKIENSRLAEKSGSLDDVIAQLAKSQARIDGLLNHIQHKSNSIAVTAENALEKEGSKQAALALGPAMAASLKHSA